MAIPHFFLFQNLKSDVLEFISIVAVEVFFVLSGIVLGPQLMRCLRSGSTADVKVFYVRRWMRTLPPYVIVLLGMAIVTGNLGSVEFFKYLVFMRNFVGISDAGDFFMPAWSLAVEEWFYLVFPAFLVIFARRGMSAAALGALFVLIFFMAKIAAWAISPETIADARRIVLLRVDAICFGFLLSLAIPQILQRRKKFLLWMLPCCLASLAATFLAAQTQQAIGYAYASSVFAASFILLFVCAEGMFQSHRFIRQVASFFASTSYMIYLVHMLLIIILLRSFDALAMPLRFAVYIVTLLAFCWLFFLFVEAPILRARPKYPDRPRSPANEALSKASS